MKRSTLMVLAMLLFLAAPQMFADVASQLVLSSGALTCTVSVSDTNAITASADCSTLTITSSGPHGELKAQGTFNGFTLTDTADGFNASLAPLLQNFNTVNILSTGSGSVTALYTDTAADEGGDTCLVTANCLTTKPLAFQVAVSTTALTLAGTANYFAFNSADGAADADVISATHLFSTFLNQGGPSSSNNGTDANAEPAGPYSLTGKIVVNFTTSGTIDASQQISASVPEPTGIILMGTLLLFTSVGLRRRKLAAPPSEV